MDIMCLTPSMWKVQSDEMVKRGWDDAVLSSAYPVHGSAIKVNHLSVYLRTHSLPCQRFPSSESSTLTSITMAL